MAGLTIPFRRDQAQDFASASGAALRASKVRQVLGTSPGELPWRTSFGAGLADLRHKNNDAVLGELARVRARDAMRTWISDVTVTSVVPERDDTTLNLRIHYVDAAGGAAEVVV